MWHYHAGHPLCVYMIDEQGEIVKLMRIGPNVEQGDQLQGVVPAGCWFASRVEEEEQLFFSWMYSGARLCILKILNWRRS